EVDEAVAVGISQRAAPVVHPVVAGGLNPEDAGLTGGLDRRRGAVRAAGAVAAAVAGETERAVDDLDASGLDLLLGLLEPGRVVDAVKEQLRARRHLMDDLGDSGAVLGVADIGAVVGEGGVRG